MVWYTFKRFVRKVSDKSGGITIPRYFFNQNFIGVNKEYVFALRVDNAPKPPMELESAPAVPASDINKSQEKIDEPIEYKNEDTYTEDEDEYI